MNLYKYIVSGKGTFPVDMLRYDCAWPSGSEDVQELSWRAEHYREIRLLSIKEPTVDRWRSFGWSVVSSSITKFTA